MTPAPNPSFAPHPASHPLPRLLVVGLGALVVPLDSSVNVAFPYIIDHFAINISDTRLIVVSFLLTSISLLLLAGRAGDVWGHRRVFQSGLVISVTGLALVASAPSFQVLLAARVLQGAGSALIIGNSPALATGLYAENRRALVIGAYAMMIAVGTAIGPILGGLLTDAWAWRWVFWFRVPIAFAALILSPLLPREARPQIATSFNFAGASFLCVCIAALFITLNLAWAGGTAWVFSIVVAALAVLLFGRRQMADREDAAPPIIELAYFRKAWFSVLMVASLAVNMAGFTIMLLAPFFLRQVAGLELGPSGLILASYPAGLALAALATGRLLVRKDMVPVGGARSLAARLLVAAPVLAGAGLWLISGWTDDTASGVLLGTMLLTGAGIGLYQAAYLYIVTGEISRASRGVAGSLAELTRTSGNLAAASVLFELFRVFAVETGFLGAFQATFKWAVVIAAAVFLLSLLSSRGDPVGAKLEPTS